MSLECRWCGEKPGPYGWQTPCPKRREPNGVTMPHQPPEPPAASIRYLCTVGEHENPDEVHPYVSELGERFPEFDFKPVWIRRQDNIGASVFWCPEHGPLYAAQLVRGDHPETLKQTMPDGLASRGEGSSQKEGRDRGA